MFIFEYFFYFILTHSLRADPQINLFFTDESKHNDQVFQHDCLRYVHSLSLDSEYHVLYFCLSELSSTWTIEPDDKISSLTLNELRHRNVTSDDLYLWSASIDLIEEYQSNVDKNLPSSNDILFHNCTWPRFGPQCQYEFETSRAAVSLEEYIQEYYRNSQRETTPTCYVHFNCTRGSFPVCLQWSDICDGEIQCHDTGEDEKHCWQLEVNECQENEYRCRNGQCILDVFFDVGRFLYDCIDRSDERRLPIYGSSLDVCDFYRIPSFDCDDTRSTYKLFPSYYSNVELMDFDRKSLSIDDQTVPTDCWEKIMCLTIPGSCMRSLCKRFCSNSTREKAINDVCPNRLLLKITQPPSNNIHFIFDENKIHDVLFPSNLGRLYICYRSSFLHAFFHMNFILAHNGSYCLFSETLLNVAHQNSSANELPRPFVRNLYDKLQRFYVIDNADSRQLCERSNMYQCRNSTKCISIYRFADNFHDCPSVDDEIIDDRKIIERIEKTHFRCATTGRYVLRRFLKDGHCDCDAGQRRHCEDEQFDMDSMTEVSFLSICDGFQESALLLGDGRNETDETDCELWECDNVYTHCNGIWNCPNAVDETGCKEYSTVNCSAGSHYCVSQESNALTCLPIERVNDGRVDCLGGTDELSLCTTIHKGGYYSDFSCRRNSSSEMCLHPDYLCNGEVQCWNGEDEQFCTANRSRAHSIDDRACWLLYPPPKSDSERFLCHYFERKAKHRQTNFHVHEELATQKHQQTITINSNLPNFRCHRGMDIVVWHHSKKNLSSRACLCPMMYHGPQCQYQTERVSLTAKFQALSDSWQTLFVIVFTLVDDSEQRLIHSYETIDFLWKVSCKSKFNFYLLYSTRPKDQRKSYSIQIDIYEKDSLKYRGSALYPVRFSFLPVYRLSVLVDIPRTDDQSQFCSHRACVHGRCVQYQGQTFCHCDEGWSGQSCSIQHQCACSTPDARCAGLLTDNRSICVCGANRFGSRCFLRNTICEKNDNSTCVHGGRCLPNGGGMLSNAKFVCICPDDYSGDRCAVFHNRLIISFTKEILLSPLVYMHFIDTISARPPTRATTFRSLPPEQTSLTIGWSNDFNLVLIELSNKRYYLVAVKAPGYFNTIINKTISASDHCPNATEFFDQTFRRWPLIRRMKSYHLPCQNLSFNLSCFHDEAHLCFCYTFHGRRLANCLQFDHGLRYNCDGRSECENEGQCFQNEKDCPSKSLCLCQPCSFGKRCQFRTSGFGLSLDAILGHHIEPELSLTQQSALVQFSLALTILFVLAGLTDGFLSLITFKNQPVRNVGCGVYLLCSSITTLLTSVMLLLKVSLLLSVQMKTISNRHFLNIQCRSLDFVLRLCLYFDQWLAACVAVERTFTVMQETRFDKQKSRQAVKYVIVFLLIILLASTIQDPLHRRLIDERNDDSDEVKRTWCIITYSSTLVRRFNSYMHTFHFLIPFVINLVSATLLITTKSRQQLRIHQTRSYRLILREQYYEHKHLLIAPIVLVLLALPRIILTFISKCMESSDDAWFYVILYFISFIPTMLTFVVFILPSKFYKKEFSKSVAEYRKTMERRLHLTETD